MKIGIQIKDLSEDITERHNIILVKAFSLINHVYKIKKENIIIVNYWVSFDMVDVEYYIKG